MAVTTINTSKDASALEGSDGWSGWDNHHPVGFESGIGKFRSFIYFPISFTGWTGVSDSKLWLRAHRDSGGGNHVYGNSDVNRTLQVRRMLKDWGEGTDRGESVWSSAETWGWNNRAEADARTAAGIGTRDFTTDPTNGNWYSVNITEIVQAWYGGEANYGVILTNTNETSSEAGLEFYSRHAGAGYKPYIEITYSTNVAPNAPTSLSPTADALVNTLSPNLTATRSDSDSGDYITAHQIRLYADNGTTLIWDSGTITDSGSPTTFSTTYAGPSLTGNTFYKWQARTRDKGGEWGPYSALSRFKVNTPPNPASVQLAEGSASDVLDLTPDFVVKHSDNDLSDTLAYGYRIVLTKSDGTAVWDSGDVDISGSPLETINFTYAGPVLDWQQQYNIKARTKDSNGVWGNYSGDYFFTTHFTRAAVNVDPSGGEVISGLVPTFYGERGSTNDTITGYVIQLYANNGSQLVWNSGTLSTGITGGASFTKVYDGAALSYNTQYSWRVSLNGSIGGTSAYTTFTQFWTPLDASVPTQNMPTTNNGTRVTTLTPTLSGSRTSAFTNYQIELYPASAVTGNLGSPIWDSGNLSQASSTNYSKVYNGPALAWNTTYKWRVRVGAPTLGNYTGLASFTTDAAGTPTLTAPINNVWGTSQTPTFTGTSAGGQSITAVRILVYNAAGSTLIWDSGDLAQSAATSFSKPYTGPTLAVGAGYQWQARYTMSTGPTGNYSSMATFYINGAPTTPTQLEPTPGAALTDSLAPRFRAFFNDPDRLSRGDYPTQWNIEIRNNATDALIQSKTLSTGLVADLNSYTWGTNTGGADTGLAYGVEYKWRTRFTDSKSAVGAYSSYQTFHAGQSPTVTITDPSNGSNINTTRPTITWNFTSPSSQTQLKFIVRVYRAVNSTKVYDSGTVVSATPSFRIPAGYLAYNGETYNFEVIAWDTDNLQSLVAMVSVQLQLAAPPAVEGLSATVIEEQSRIALSWDKTVLGSSFVTYVVYRRKISDTDWTMVGVRKPETNTSFNDWYAGQGQEYEYRVTVVKLLAGEPDLESPDSDIAVARLETDTWMVVGLDRAESHIFELPVSAETHTRPVQQEVFEPLGTNRKAVVRGFVLGHEGSLNLVWHEEDAPDSREKVEYLLYYPGPHILKDPFGNVYDVTFAGPDSSYLGGGGLEQVITWIEVGTTNNPGLTPDEYLAQIGAE